MTRAPWIIAWWLACAATCVACAPGPEVAPHDASGADVADATGGSAGAWSIGFYPGWVQNQMPPSAVDFTPWTHVFHFGMYPDAQGNVLVADLQSTAYATAAVAATHAAGRPIVLVIGGEGQGRAFAASTGATYRDAFVRNIVTTMQRYGYDGVDVDWEEDLDAGQLATFMTALHAALAAIAPRPLLTLEVDPGQVPPAAAAVVASLVDAVNVMAYDGDGHAEIAAYRAAGIPADKLVLGIGLTDVYADTTVAHVQAKVDYAQANGLRGVDAWQFGDLHGWTDPRLAPLRALVNAR